MKSEIQKYLQDYINKMQAKGMTPTLQQMNEHLAGFMRDVNNQPREDFEGYSPIEMSKILDYTFDINSPVQFNNLTSEDYNEMPLFRQVQHLLKILAGREVKLTKAGNLPTIIVKELYPLGIGDTLIDKGVCKLNKEADSSSVFLARNISEMAGLTKVRKGVLSATASGKKITDNAPMLFKQIFETFCRKFNWAYFDRYQSQKIGRFGFGFTLILLKKYGGVKREDNFYSSKYFKALPALTDGIVPTHGTVEDYCSKCYSLRTFDRFLFHFSLVVISQEREYDTPKFITKTPLFDKLIEILPHGSLGF